MALQCTQIPISASVRFDKTPEAVVAPYRKSFYGKVGLQNSNITLQARFLRHCKRDITKQLRQGNIVRTVCVRAKEPKPTWIEMTPITGEAQFDEALESEKPIIIEWCFLFSPQLNWNYCNSLISFTLRCVLACNFLCSNELHMCDWDLWCAVGWNVNDAYV